jgi:hypothetical protein
LRNIRCEFKNANSANVSALLLTLTVIFNYKLNFNDGTISNETIIPRNVVRTLRFNKANRVSPCTIYLEFLVAERDEALSTRVSIFWVTEFVGKAEVLNKLSAFRIWSQVD